MYSTDDPPVPYLIENRVIVSGENLVDAQATFDQRTNEPIISFRFNNAGARKFGDITAENVGKPFAIVLDNKVITAPVIRSLFGMNRISVLISNDRVVRIFAISSGVLGPSRKRTSAPASSARPQRSTASVASSA